MTCWCRLSANSLQKESAEQKMRRIRPVILYGREFGIYIYHGIYDIPKKGSDQSEQWESEEVYSFLVCVAAPVDKDYNAGNPKCGFIFPAFEDRSSEPEKIDIFFENSDRPDEGFLKKILGK